MQNWSRDADAAPPPTPPTGGAPRPAAPPPQEGAPQWGAPPPQHRPGWAPPPPPQDYRRLAWQPAPPEPGPTFATRVGIVAIALTVVAAIVIVSFSLASRPQVAVPTTPPGPETSVPASPTPVVTPTPAPSIDRTWSPSPLEPPTPTTGVTVAPEPGGRAWELPARTWPELPAPDPKAAYYAAQKTPLDDLPPVTLLDCPRPETVRSEAEWKDAVRAQWSCIHRAWEPVYRQLGWSTVEPQVMFYPGAGSKSECGYLEAPAFYCSAGEGTVYFGQDHFEMATAWDLSVNEMVNHEYGHHIQKLAGITQVKMDLPFSNELDRRAELQATCMSAMMTYHNRSFAFGEDDLASWNERLATMLVDGTHGNRESLTYWGTRGLYAERVGDCNTWVVPKDEVA